MENDNKKVKRTALAAWLLAACLVALATVSAKADDTRIECGMGVTIGVQARGN